jgi:hypothetical protein
MKSAETVAIVALGPQSRQPDKPPSRKRSNMEIPLEEGAFFWKFPASPAIRGRED